MIKSSIVVAMAIALSISVVSLNIQASDAGAFIGGILTVKVLDNMQRQTQAQEAQAYHASRAAAPVYSSAPSSGAHQSSEDRLRQLDRLAAGGYITPQEYKAKRKAILDDR